MTTLIVLGVLAAIVAFAIVLYNQLVRLRNASEGAWSDVDVQLKRRYELIPNLIETVKGYAAHEKSAFDAVTKARSQAMQATTPEGKSAAEGGLSASLKSLFAVAEAYPELKANENFLSLQAELAKLEDAIQNARRYYNAIVRDLNIQLRGVPEQSRGQHLRLRQEAVLRARFCRGAHGAARPVRQLSGAGGMRRAVFAALCGLLVAGSTARAEVIRSFESEVRLSDAYDFEVEERIRWDFEGAQKHGIFRNIPVRYQRRGLPDYRIRVDVESVTDENGIPYPYRERSLGSTIELRIGDPDVTVTGLREYRIRYRVGRALLYFEDHDELYWNATGDEWPVPIERAVATVAVPPKAATSEVRRTCFAGPRGSALSDCESSEGAGVVRFVADRALDAGSGLTVVVGLPKGILPEPSALQRFMDRASDFLSPWLLLPVVAFVFMWRRWQGQGRDPQGADALPVRYEPPASLTPAEVGTVLDESADTLDITASILDLAVRGLLTIEELESSRFLFLSSRDYRLRRTEADASGLKPHERLLLDALFAGGSSVLLSDLKEKFYKSIPGITKALYKGLSGAEGYFPTSPDRVRQNYAFAGIVTVGIAGLAAFAQQGPIAIGSAALAGGIVLAFSRVMPRRTKRGRRACDEILGFREFLKRVDQDRLERSGGITAGRFEKILPYAVVLGAADLWADAFAGIYTKPPDWYQSSRYRTGFHTRDFVSDVGQSLSSMGSTLTSRPSSSGSGSSGFGGGGFSGGGFGGGGGGSW